MPSELEAFLKQNRTKVATGILDDLDKHGIKYLADMGGDWMSYLWLKGALPHATISTVNCAEKKGAKFDDYLREDVQDVSLKDSSMDLMAATEIIEHLLSPERFLMQARRILKPGGYMLLSTPNLASWFNRLYLLFGKTPPNYDPDSLKFRIKTKEHWLAIGHKSLFTLNELKKVLNAYGFRIITIKSHGYFDCNRMDGRGPRLGGLRGTLNTVLPMTFREGFTVLARCQK